MPNLLDKPAPKTQRGSIPFANESAGIWKLISLSTLADKLRSFLNPIYAAITEPLFSAWLETYVPGGSSGPQSLTIAEAEALIGSFAVGSQYIITDWQPSTLLYADTVSTMKPMSGSTTLMNGEELPYVMDGETKVYWVMPDTLFVDTGEINWDISTETGIPLLINVSSAFVLDRYSIICGIDIQPLNCLDDNGSPVCEELYYPQLSICQRYRVNKENRFVLFSCVEAITDLRIVCKFERVKVLDSLPIPIILIPTAEYIDKVLFIQLPFNNPMRDPSAYLSDFTLTVNSSPATITSVSLDSDPTKFIITPESPFANGDVITISITSGNIKNTWGGVFAGTPEPVSIINNVPA